MATYEIITDTEAPSPREEFDNIATLALNHRRYDLANEAAINFDNYSSWDEVREAIEALGGIHVTPVWMYDHGSVMLSAGDANPFSDPWDSGQVGFAYTTADQMEFLGVSDANVAEAFALDITAYSAWLAGDVLAVIIRDDNGEITDTIGGFYTLSDAENEALTLVEER